MEIKKHYASFSEAIREGAKLRPQIFNVFATKNGTCALGAGAEAITGERCYATDVCEILEATYGYMTVWRDCVHCPLSDGTFLYLRDAVIHLNDEHHWTRERIADWLETEEEKLGYVTLVESAPDNLSLKTQHVENQGLIAALK